MLAAMMGSILLAGAGDLTNNLFCCFHSTLGVRRKSEYMMAQICIQYLSGCNRKIKKGKTSRFSRKLA